MEMNTTFEYKTKIAVIQFRDGSQHKVKECPNHWDNEDIIHLCLVAEDWRMVDRVLFVYDNT